ncbi:MAG: C25 family peptidase propeptide domain-containing protein, partial [Melioribacteraceae bacterium]
MKTKFSLLFLFFILNLTVSAQDIRVLSSDLNSIIIEYKPIYGDTVRIFSQGEQFLRINLLGGISDFSLKPGAPQFQFRSLNIGVPSETGNTIQMISSDFSILGGRYVPVPQLEKDTLGTIQKYVAGAEYGSSSFADPVSFGEFGLMRELPVQTVRISPIQFDGSSNTIRVYTRLLFKISYAPAVSGREQISDDLLQSAVINWDSAKNWGFSQSRLRKTSNSVFADGDWYRLETPEEGIYKIERSLLQTLGVDVNNLDPRKIKIFGYGGYSLPEEISLSKSSGPVENAIIVTGESDGRFDAGDYILFYGRPP